MPRLSSMFALVGVLLVAIPAHAAPIDFIIDDGTSDNAFGNFSGTPGDALALNRFDAGPGGATIDEIQYVMGTPAAPPAGFGSTFPGPVTIVLYSDASANGIFDMATLLIAVVDNPVNFDNDVFNSIFIAPTFVTGEFYVGVFGAALDDQGLVGADTNDPPGPTSIFAGTALDLDNVLGTADIFAFDPDFTGIALIRAFGDTPVPEPPTLLLGALGLGAIAAAMRWRRRQN